MNTRDRDVEDVVTAWTRWAERPGSEERAVDCVDAVRRFAGDDGVNFRRFVTGAIHDLGCGVVARDLRDIVTRWRDDHANR